MIVSCSRQATKEGTKGVEARAQGSKYFKCYFSVAPHPPVTPPPAIVPPPLATVHRSGVHVPTHGQGKKRKMMG